MPSIWASISWMTLVSLSASSAERRPLLIFSANRLMSLCASNRKEWSGWSSAVCFSRSCIHPNPLCVNAVHPTGNITPVWLHIQICHLDQQLISRNPLHRLYHQVTQTLFLFVLTHILLYWVKDKIRKKKKETAWENNWNYVASYDKLLKRAKFAIHFLATRGQSCSTVNHLASALYAIVNWDQGEDMTRFCGAWLHFWILSVQPVSPVLPLTTAS